MRPFGALAVSSSLPASGGGVSRLYPQGRAARLSAKVAPAMRTTVCHRPAVHAMRRRAPRATAGAQSWHKNEPTRSSNPVGLDQGLRNLQNGVVAEYAGARGVHGRLTVFAVEQSVRFLGWLRTDRPRANAAACLPATVTVTNSGVIVTGVAAWFGRMRVPGPKKLSGPVDDGSRRG